MCALGVVECLIIIYTIYMQKIHEVFIPKTMFTCYLCYHFCFILLNLSLYYEWDQNQNGLDTSFTLDAQEILVYSILVLNGLMMITDLVPYEYVRSKDTFMSELEDD